MAEATPDEGFLQRRLECPVCLNTYDLKDRVPMGLYCMHTICKGCVDTLAKSPPIKCPKCKRSSDVDALRRNFGLCDVLEKLCQVCCSREIVAECDHCHKNLCSVCLEGHAEVFEDDVTKSMSQLRAAVKASAEMTIDEIVLERERKFAADTITKIQGEIAKYQEEIRKREADLKSKVTELRNLNVQKYKTWQKRLAAEVEKCKAFLETSEDKLRSTLEVRCPTKTLAAINDETQRLLAELQDIQKSTPPPVQYKYVGPQSSPQVGEVVCQASSLHEVRAPPVSLPVDYTRARSIAMSGSKGSGPEQFEGDGYVTCTGDKYIVADTHNHRIKIYNRSLKVVHMFGEKGTERHQFQFPRGVCVSPTGELYVSDTCNHSVKVYDTKYQLVRSFGSYGSGDDQVKFPRGLAFTSTGELLVADGGNHRVKVLTPGGRYIRSIGSQGEGLGQFKERPSCVAVTLDGSHVLVSEKDGARLLKFTLDGVYVQDLSSIVSKTQHSVKIFGFTIDNVGNIIIGDIVNHQLIVLNAQDQFVCAMWKKGNQPGELLGPQSVSVNGNRLLVYECGNVRIQIFEA